MSKKIFSFLRSFIGLPSSGNKIRYLALIVLVISQLNAGGKAIGKVFRTDRNLVEITGPAVQKLQKGSVIIIQTPTEAITAVIRETYHTKVVCFVSSRQVQLISAGNEIFLAEKSRPKPAAKAAIASVPSVPKPIELPANPDAALFFAVELQPENLEAVQMAIKAGANVNTRDEKKRTPLSVAVDLDHAQTADFLITSGADRKIKNINNWSLFELAAFHDFSDTVAVLLKHGENPDREDAEGDERIVYHAAYTQKYKVVEACLKAGASVDKKDDGHTMISKSVYADDVRMTEILLRYKADANQKTYLGDRLLHVAIRKKNSGMVNLLLRSGADPNRTNENDETPLQAASAIGDSKILEMLQSAGAK